jgi:hypothetical protein
MGRRHHQRRRFGANQAQNFVRPSKGAYEPRKDAAALWLEGDSNWMNAANALDQTRLIERRADEKKLSRRNRTYEK